MRFRSIRFLLLPGESARTDIILDLSLTISNWVLWRQLSRTASFPLISEQRQMFNNASCRDFTGGFKGLTDGRRQRQRSRSLLRLAIVGRGIRTDPCCQVLPRRGIQAVSECDSEWKLHWVKRELVGTGDQFSINDFPIARVPRLPGQRVIRIRSCASMESKPGGGLSGSAHARLRN